MTSELLWVSEHEEELKSYAGQWIAVKGSSLIAHGETLKAVLDEAKAKGIDHPFITRIAVEDDGVVIARNSGDL